MSPRDLGTIYVYQADVELYEVDWELTTMPPAVFEAVAVAAHQSGQMLPCRLVLPRARRRKNGNRPKMVLSVAGPVTYGQMRMLI